MADFDSAAKRFSGMGLGLSEAPLLPIPDGTIATADMQHFLDAYSGIAFGGVVTPTGGASSFSPSSSAASTLLRPVFTRGGYSGYTRSTKIDWRAVLALLRGVPQESFA